MQTITVVTGFGYLTNADGVVMSKAILPPGEHPIHDGYTYTEVADEAALAAIVTYPDVTPAYLASKEYAQDIFDYKKCMEDLNVAFWDRMTVLAPIVGLITLWLQWKNFTAIKDKGLSWVADSSMAFEQQDFDLLNTVLKIQNIDLLDW